MRSTNRGFLLIDVQLAVAVLALTAVAASDLFSGASAALARLESDERVAACAEQLFLGVVLGESAVPSGCDRNLTVDFQTRRESEIEVVIGTVHDERNHQERFETRRRAR